MPARLTRIAPQFLVDDLEKAIAYYRRELGFDVDFRAHRKDNDHLDAYIDVSNVDALFAELTQRKAKVTKGLEHQPWQCRDFWVEDIDGYILCFSEGTA